MSFETILSPREVAIETVIELRGDGDKDEAESLQAEHKITDDEVVAAMRQWYQFTNAEIAEAMA